jgi:tripartite-type tricarboxylate transporter receptor subunit TctC
VETDFTPVAYLAITPIALITRPDPPASNLKDFVAYASQSGQNAIRFRGRRLRHASRRAV